MAPFPTQPPQEPPFQQLGVESVGLCPAMLPRYRETGGMDHMRLDVRDIDLPEFCRPLHRICMREVRLDPDHDAVMRICGKAPGGGPFFQSADPA